MGSYTGVDTSTDVVDFLTTNVDRPDLRFIHIDAQNTLYNPGGTPLDLLTIPEIADQTFDLICLFSVFTHLDPTDTASMLRLMRRHIAPGGHAYFTIFLNERTTGGHGFIDKVHAGQLAKEQAEPVNDASDVEAWNSARVDVPDYIEGHPTPLVISLYSRRHALELIESAGWRVVSVSEPDIRQQHHIVCTPAG